MRLGALDAIIEKKSEVGTRRSSITLVKLGMLKRDVARSRDALSVRFFAYSYLIVKHSIYGEKTIILLNKIVM